MPSVIRPSSSAAAWSPLLTDAAHVLESIDEPERRVDRVLDLLRHTLPCDHVVLLEREPVLSRDVTVVPDVAPERRPALVERAGRLLELLREPRSARPAASPGHSHLAVPLLGASDVIGLLYLERRDGEYDETDVALLAATAAQLAAYVTVLRAERERKRLEAERASLATEQQRTLALMEMFVGVLGHDLRNPLHAILMSAEVLRVTGERPPDPRVVKRVLDSAQRMGRLVDQLLDVTRIRLGRGLPIERGPVDLARVCEQGVEELRTGHASAHIEIAIGGDTSGEWDGDRLLQVVSNLVENALRHGDAARPVGVELDGGDPALVLLRVRNGGAIPKDILPVLFDPFRGAVASASGTTRGLGLGLYIVREIVAAHDGSIGVESDESRGTRVTVELPRRPSAH
jgi:signal transduction histidine kinase